MANVWPGTLPQIPLYNSSETFESGVLFLETEWGPGKTRPRFNAAPRPITIPLVLTDTQMSVLDTFFHTTLVNGAATFEWAHPRTGVTSTFRFKPGSPPSFVNMSFGLWKAVIQLDIMP